MSDEPLDERQVALNACSCPRSAGEILSAPKCAAKHYIPPFKSDGKPLLFVKNSHVQCLHLVPLGQDYFCNCANRIKFYSTYKF